MKDSILEITSIEDGSKLVHVQKIDKTDLASDVFNRIVFFGQASRQQQTRDTLDQFDKGRAQVGIECQLDGLGERILQ